MSMKCKETVTCPECGQEQDFIVWHSLNGDLNPEAKQQLLDGKLFHFECSNCGHRSNVDYGMLYHDMTNQVMVYFADEDSVAETLTTMNDTENKIGIPMPEYRKRVVTDQNALREKAIIFNQKLDDRVIEIIKLIYYSNASKQVPDANINAVYFLVADGKYILQFIGEKSLSAEVPVEMYEKIKSDFAERLEKAGDKDALVDLHWASEFLRCE
ncbi:CpXC protein [Peptostreptococcaceae bacterium pGA-8]|nr:CpXC protein [Peptostreptococcaceae bacterium pGA-8]